MAEFCNQCAKMYGFPEGDFKTEEKLEPGLGWGVLCEGCGPILVDSDGNCLAESMGFKCDEPSHYCK